MKFIILLTFLSLALIVTGHPGLHPLNLRGTSEKPGELLRGGWDLKQEKKLEFKSGEENEKEKIEKVHQNRDDGWVFKVTNGDASSADILWRKAGKIKTNGKVRHENGEDFLRKSLNTENEGKVLGKNEGYVEQKNEKRELEKFSLEPVEGRFAVYKTESGHLVRLVEASGFPAGRNGFGTAARQHYEIRTSDSGLPPASRQAGYRTSGLSRTMDEFGDRARFWPFTSWYDDYSYGYGGYYPYYDYYHY